jgi:hypothetical protein
MSFIILSVRDGEAPDDPLYPIPGETANTVELTEADGQPLAYVTATELSVAELTAKPRRIFRVEKVKAALIVTDSRVAVACSKYEKGGGWMPLSVGAIPVAIASNTASKVMASRRRRGKMLVGQVNYPYLSSVGCRRTGVMRPREQLRLNVFDPTMPSRATLALDITLAAGSQSAGSMSQQIVSRAAAHRLESGERLDGRSRELLQRLLTPEPLAPTGDKNFSLYSLPD